MRFLMETTSNRSENVDMDLSRAQVVIIGNS